MNFTSALATPEALAVAMKFDDVLVSDPLTLEEQRKFALKLDVHQHFTMAVLPPKVAWKGVTETNTVNITEHELVVTSVASGDASGGPFSPAKCKVVGAPHILSFDFPPDDGLVTILALERTTADRWMTAERQLVREADPDEVPAPTAEVASRGKSRSREARQTHVAPTPPNQAARKPHSDPKTAEPKPLGGFEGWEARDEIGGRRVVVWVGTSSDPKSGTGDKFSIDDAIEMMGFEVRSFPKGKAALEWIEKNFDKVLAVVTSSLIFERDSGGIGGHELLQAVCKLRADARKQSASMASAEASTSVTSSPLDADIPVVGLGSIVAAVGRGSCKAADFGSQLLAPMLVLQSDRIEVSEAEFCDVFIRARDFAERARLVHRELAKWYVKPVCLYIKKEPFGHLSERFGVGATREMERNREYVAKERVKQAGFSLVERPDTVSGFQYIQQNVGRLAIVITGSFERAEKLGHLNGIEIASRVKKMSLKDHPIKTVSFSQQWEKDSAVYLDKKGANVVSHEAFDMCTAEFGASEEKAIEAILDFIKREGDARKMSEGQQTGSFYFTKNVDILLANTFEGPNGAIVVPDVLPEKTLRFPTVEHYYQAAKHLKSDRNLAISILEAGAVHKAFQLSLTKKVSDKRWRNLREECMDFGVRSKFVNDANAALLKKTGAKQIVLHQGDDEFWGDAGDGSGKNKIGLLLQRIRDDLNLSEKLALPKDPLENDTGDDAGGMAAPSDMTDNAMRKRLFQIDRNNVLGKGGNAVVYMAKDNYMGYNVAAKEADLKAGKAAREQLIADFDAMSRLKHRNIVRVYFADIEADHALFYMEWMPGGSLEKQVESFRAYETSIISWVRQALDGLIYLHRDRNFVHGDIKPHNILLNEHGAKLSDFGLCDAQQKSQRDGAVQSNYGTPQYMSPERYRDSLLTQQDDVWALGVTVLRLATGGKEQPWGKISNNVNKICARLVEAQTANDQDKLWESASGVGDGLILPKTLSKWAVAFVKRCLTLDPKKRPSAETLAEDPWLRALRTDASFDTFIESPAAYENAKRAAAAEPADASTPHLPRPPAARRPSGSAGAPATVLTSPAPELVGATVAIGAAGISMLQMHQSAEFSPDATQDTTGCLGRGAPVNTRAALMLRNLEADFNALLRRHVNEMVSDGSAAEAEQAYALLERWAHLDVDRVAAVMAAFLVKAKRARASERYDPVATALADVLRFIMRRVRIATGGRPSPPAGAGLSPAASPTPTGSVAAGSEAGGIDFLSGIIRAAEDIVEVIRATSELPLDDDFHLVNEQYFLEKVLGKGQQGEVWKATDVNNKQERAVKIVKRPTGLNSATEMQRLEQEISIMCRLQHHFIVRLYEVIDAPKANQMYLILQYVKGGTLGQLNRTGALEGGKTIKPALLAKYLRQISAALLYLHENHVVHNDIKPENVLVDEEKCIAYLADFGVSTLFHDASTPALPNADELDGGVMPARSSGKMTVAGDFAETYGTPTFGPPDPADGSTAMLMTSAVVKNLSADAQQRGFAADVYALGLTAYVCLYGCLPFALPDDDLTMGEKLEALAAAKRQAFQFKRTLPDGTPLPHADMWHDLLRGMLDANRAARCTLEDARAILKELEKAMNAQSAPAAAAIGGGLKESKDSRAKGLSAAAAAGVFAAAGEDFHEGRDFREIGELGGGAFGKVTLVEHVTSKCRYALKSVQKQILAKHARDCTSELAAFEVEKKVLSGCKHPHIVKFFGAYSTDTALCYVLDYHSGETLTKRLARTPPVSLSTVRVYTKELLSAVAYLHDHGVIFRDLKPDNVLMTKDGHCVLCDFGLAKVHGESVEAAHAAAAHTCVGTPVHVAPEIVEQAEYNATVDLWSLGTVVFQMAYNRPPFAAAGLYELQQKIKNDPPEFPGTAPLEGSVEAYLRDFVCRCLAKRANGPGSRWTAKQALLHPFIAGGGDVPRLSDRPEIADWVPPKSEAA